MLVSLGWRRLDLRRIDARLGVFYKIRNDLVAIPLVDYLTTTNRPPRHSHPQAFRTIQALTDTYKFSFFPRTVVHWNALRSSAPPHHSSVQFCCQQNWTHLTVGRQLCFYLTCTNILLSEHWTLTFLSHLHFLLLTFSTVWLAHP